jgi:hypothetical protein
LCLTLLLGAPKESTAAYHLYLTSFDRKACLSGISEEKNIELVAE